MKHIISNLKISIRRKREKAAEKRKKLWPYNWLIVSGRLVQVTVSTNIYFIQNIYIYSTKRKVFQCRYITPYYDICNNILRVASKNHYRCSGISPWCHINSLTEFYTGIIFKEFSFCKVLAIGSWDNRSEAGKHCYSSQIKIVVTSALPCWPSLRCIVRHHRWTDNAPQVKNPPARKNSTNALWAYKQNELS